MSRRSTLELLAQKWVGRNVVYAPGRAGKVYDLTTDGEKLLILRNHKRSEEKGMVVISLKDPDLQIIDSCPCGGTR